MKLGCLLGHAWISLSTQRMETAHFTRKGVQIGPSLSVTEVLQRCDRCGNVRTVTLDGTWTLAELQR